MKTCKMPVPVPVIPVKAPLQTEDASVHQSVLKPLVSPFCYHPLVITPPEGAAAHHSIRKPLVSPTRHKVFAIIPCEHTHPEGASAHQSVRNHCYYPHIITSTLDWGSPRSVLLSLYSISPTVYHPGCYFFLSAKALSQGALYYVICGIRVRTQQQACPWYVHRYAYWCLMVYQVHVYTWLSCHATTAAAAAARAALLLLR